MKESFTPYNKAELVACFHEIDRWLPVTVKPAAAKVLGPWKLSRVGDVLELREVWPYGQLRNLSKAGAAVDRSNYRVGGEKDHGEQIIGSSLNRALGLRKLCGKFLD